MDRKSLSFQKANLSSKAISARFKRLLFPKTDGYLQVTNKRIIYATSTQLGGSNLVSELPLMDVGSDQFFIGKSIKIGLYFFVGAAFMIGGF